MEGESVNVILIVQVERGINYYATLGIEIPYSSHVNRAA